MNPHKGDPLERDRKRLVDGIVRRPQGGAAPPPPDQDPHRQFSASRREDLWILFASDVKPTDEARSARDRN